MDTFLFLLGYYGIERTKDSILFLYNIVYKLIYPNLKYNFKCNCCGQEKKHKVECGCNICVNCIFFSAKDKCLECNKENILKPLHKNILLSKLNLIRTK